MSVPLGLLTTTQGGQMNYLVCLSGGIDSSTSLAFIHSNTVPNKRIAAISFKYPSKHNLRELQCAGYIAAHFGIPHFVHDVTCLFVETQSSLLYGGDDIPEGHYAGDNMKSTVVPMRNLVFAMAAAAEGHHIFNGEDFTLVLGVHQGDHYIYPDCRPATMEALRQALKHGSDGLVSLFTPILYLDKTEVVRMGIERKVPFHLTRTCYTSGQKACGKCGACVERLEAFKNVRMIDPIEYEK